VDRDIGKRRRKIEKSKKQAERIEEKIPPLELEISGIDADIKRLHDEMKTELTSTLSDEEKQLLVNLKEAEKNLEAEIEKQNDEVSKIGLKRQRLQSLLEDNLYKRKEELRGLAVPNQEDEEESAFAGRASGGRSTSAARIAQQKNELEEKQHELEAAARVLHGIEERLAEARKAEEEVGNELNSTRAELDKHKSSDAKLKKELEEAQEKSEKMLNKVSLFCLQ
jgi:hypothetical protein